jgi:hypothetical protein
MKPLFFMPGVLSGASDRHPYSVEPFYSRSFVSIRGRFCGFCAFLRLFCFLCAFVLLCKADLSKIRDNLRRERGSHAGACIQDMLFS